MHSIAKWSYTRSAQCAAVSTKSSFTNTPPQLCLPRTCSEAMYGRECGATFLPPTIWVASAPEKQSYKNITINDYVWSSYLYHV